MPVSTQQAILDSARSEFDRLGFRGASVRDISAAAGVTTGALYGYYRNKEELFDALVATPAAELELLFRKAQDDFEALEPLVQLKEMHAHTLPRYRAMVDVLFGHLQTFRLIVCSNEGTKWQHYLDRMIALEENSTRRFLLRLSSIGIPVPSLDSLFIHMLATSLISSFFEMVRHPMTHEEALDYADALYKFYAAGWDSLLAAASEGALSRPDHT